MNYDMTAAARADMDKIAEFGLGLWGARRTSAYIARIADTFDKLASRERPAPYRFDGHDIYRENVGSHCILFLKHERALIIAVLHQRADIPTQLSARFIQ